MTASPLLPPGMTGPMAETEATDAELNRMTELALSRGARAIATGRGNSPAATRAVGEFTRRFQATGGIIICTVTWPESAASWLRQATRYAAADPDLWVMAGPATGWAQMTRRLLWSTPWRPERTIAFAAIGTRHVTGLVGAHNLPGLTGATADARAPGGSAATPAPRARTHDRRSPHRLGVQRHAITSAVTAVAPDAGAGPERDGIFLAPG